MLVLSVFTEYTTTKANGMTSVVSYMNQNSVIGVDFDRGKRNLVQVSGEFELSEFELTEIKWLKSGVTSKENGTWFELAGEFQLSEFELSGFYCS